MHDLENRVLDRQVLENIYFRIKDLKEHCVFICYLLFKNNYWRKIESVYADREDGKYLLKYITEIEQLTFIIILIQMN